MGRDPLGSWTLRAPAPAWLRQAASDGQTTAMPHPRPSCAGWSTARGQLRVCSSGCCSWAGGREGGLQRQRNGLGGAEHHGANQPARFSIHSAMGCAQPSRHPKSNHSIFGSTHRELCRAALRRAQPPGPPLIVRGGTQGFINGQSARRVDLPQVPSTCAENWSWVAGQVPAVLLPPAHVYLSVSRSCLA